MFCGKICRKVIYKTKLMKLWVGKVYIRFVASRKHEHHLWHSTICVKPEKHDFKIYVQLILNNFYLPVFIYIIYRSPDNYS